MSLRIALVSDAWTPQVNGVVRTLEATVARLRASGHKVRTITPDQFSTIRCPSYPEIKLAVAPRRKLAKLLDDFAPDAIHIATEGPLGWTARAWCLRARMPFTTSFHTRFPDYLAVRTKLPSDWFWPLIRRFHEPASRVFAATDRLAAELAERGIERTHRWSRGVDLALFSPGRSKLRELADAPGPIQLYVGRVAVEKNIEAFLRTQVPGTKVIVGDGPARAELAVAYPHARFLGALHGEALAAAYASADVLVFPSRTDTFGLVMVEALASGVPVAAYPVAGPLDILGAAPGGIRSVGALDEDLDAAIRAALEADPADCAAHGRAYDWEHCTAQFLAGLHPGARDAPVARPKRRRIRIARQPSRT